MTEGIVPGAEVQWIEIAPHPTRGLIYGRVVEVCSDCEEALIHWFTGDKERVPLSAFGRDRPRSSVRLTGRRSAALKASPLIENDRSGDNARSAG